jgi:hypothetical protein
LEGEDGAANHRDSLARPLPKRTGHRLLQRFEN